MSDFILNYDVLESIAKSSNSLGKRADEYADSLTSKIANAISNVTGPSSSYLEDASYFVNEKVRQLQKKSEEFHDFATKVTALTETAIRIDKEVETLLAESQKNFLQHHESLRIDDWKADILNWLVGIKNNLPFLEVLGNILSAVNTLIESQMDALKYWYQCEGGKYALDFVDSIALVAFAIAATVLFVVTLPASGFFTICGVIGAGIAVVNAETNVVTSWKAMNAARNGDPTRALIYGKQDKLSDVLRQTNYYNGIANGLSYLGADAIDATEIFCDVVGVAEIGKSLGKLFGNKNLNLFKNTDGFKLGDFKSSIKKTFENFKIKGKSNITGYADNVEDVTVNKLDDVVTKGGSETVTYRRVQGGQGTQSSQQRVVIDNDGNVYVNKTDKNLNISIDNGEHSQHFLKNRPDADIYELEVPKWFDDMVQENTIPQAGYKSNPLNQGGTAPKLTDPTTPGKSIEFPAPWVEWMEEHATNGRIIKGGQ